MTSRRMLLSHSARWDLHQFPRHVLPRLLRPVAEAIVFARDQACTSLDPLLASLAEVTSVSVVAARPPLAWQVTASTKLERWKSTFGKCFTIRTRRTRLQTRSKFVRSFRTP